MLKLLLGSKDNHLWHDQLCKRTKITGLDSQRKTNEEIYESAELLEEHQIFTMELLEASRVPVIFSWGDPNQKVLEREYGIEPVEGIEKWRIVEGVMIGDLEVSTAIWTLSNMTPSLF